MKKWKKILALSLLPFCFVGAFSGCTDSKKNKIVITDNQALLTNPDMGWNFTYYANTIYDFITGAVIVPGGI